MADNPFSPSVPPDRADPCLAIVLAAGKGKRMRSALPKPLHRVAGLPMLRHCLATARRAGATELALVVPPDHELFRDSLRQGGDDAALFVQAEQHGTAHAVLSARPALEQSRGDVLVLYGDTPLIRPETLEHLRAQLRDGAAVAVLGFRAGDATGYGRLVTDGHDTLLAIVEEKDATPDQRRITLCNSGLMAFRADFVLPLLDGITNENAAGEYYLTDAVSRARAMGHRVAFAVADDPQEVLGVNDREQLAAVEAAMQRRLRKAAMLSGATLIDPGSVTLSHDTTLGQDVVIEPHVVFGPGVAVGDGAIIKAFSHLEGAAIAPGASIGPFARIRPHTEIGARARIGNFVEIKEARIAPDAKVNHLSYIGDASIGAGANIGAGTITCNYDGLAKHRTEIEAGAFIGSNSSLVAPVRIGAGAYVGSGSVVSENVPRDTLVVTRAPRTMREGWPSRRRAKAKSPDGS